MKKLFSGMAILLSCILWSCGDADQGADNYEDQTVPAPVHLSFQVINEYPHDTLAFTEGFGFYKGTLYESTGSPDSPVTSGTWIASIDIPSGKYDRKVDLGSTYFGEGITFFNDRLYQLTWKSQKGFVYDANTFKKVREFNYKSEGWGLTNDNQHLIMSAGTSNLYYLTPDSLSFVRMLAVQDNNGYVGSINELEYIDGYIYANKWLTNEIVKIDPATGYVLAKLDLSKQVADVKRKYPDAQELNGIAHDSTSGKTYVTGKKWPVIYEIKW